MSTTLTRPEFDYTAITDPLLADQLRNRADEICALRRGIEANFMAIGQQLLATKDQLPHGQFTAWVEQACGFSHRTANRLMTVAREFGQNRHCGEFGISILEQLAAAPDPQAALATAETLAANGQPVTRESAHAIAHGLPVPNTNPDPRTGTPAERILAAFATGSESKTTGLLCRLTGLNDLDLAHELTALVESGHLLRVGDSGKLFKITVKVTRAADSRITDDEQRIQLLGAKIAAWLREQSEPRGLLTLQAALDPQARIADVVAAVEHMIALGHIERVNKNYFRAVTLEDDYAREAAEAAAIGDPFAHALKVASEMFPEPAPAPVQAETVHAEGAESVRTQILDEVRALSGVDATDDQILDAFHQAVGKGQAAPVASEKPGETADAAPGEAVSEPPAKPKGHLQPTDVAEVRRLLHPGNNDLKTLFKKVSFDEHRLSAVLKHLEAQGDVKLGNGIVTYAPRLMRGAAEPSGDVKCFRYASQVQTPFVLGLFDILKAVGDERVRAIRSVESWYALGGDQLQTTRDRIAQVQRELVALTAHLSEVDAKIAGVQPRAVDVAAQHAVKA